MALKSRRPLRKTKKKTRLATLYARTAEIQSPSLHWEQHNKCTITGPTFSIGRRPRVIRANPHRRCPNREADWIDYNLKRGSLWSSLLRWVVVVFRRLFIQHSVICSDTHRLSLHVFNFYHVPLGTHFCMSLRQRPLGKNRKIQYLCKTME